MTVYHHLREERMNFRGSIGFGGGRSKGWQGPARGGSRGKGDTWAEKLDPDMARLLPSGKEMENVRQKISKRGMRGSARKMAGFMRERRWKMMGYDPNDPPPDPVPYPMP